LDVSRYLVVTADDYGIGPATSQGILDLAARGLVASTVLLVNSPHAESAVHAWRQSGANLELGWHPCITLDQPVLPAARVPSLVDPEGQFWPLGTLLRRLYLGLVTREEIDAELRAQYQLFLDLVGRPPPVVNAHHHVQVFPPIGTILRGILADQKPRPYLRRVQEPWALLRRVPGARGKRAFLTLLGRREAWHSRRAGFPGNDWLAGITDPPWVADPDYLRRWLTCIPGWAVELTCHPGYLDPTLVGRDGSVRDGLLQRRVHELERLGEPAFRDACRQAGFALIPASALLRLSPRGHSHAA
jgi:predicted glycoside hydrolase/deacetylase ChbG (UPF0249 family)